MMQKLFISYARKDGRELALRLRADLNARGYDVWLDTSAITGGGDWSRAIEDAIDGCEAALALLSHASHTSEICRAEQMMCRDRRKRIIPLLVQADAPRPVHLYTRNYRDFSGGYDGALALLLDDLANPDGASLPEPPYHAVNTARKLPENFIQRPEELDRLRQQVIGDDTDRHIAVTALRGLGGIGKSVLATALCHDRMVQAAFPDGVIWLDIGRERSSLLEPMRVLGTTLGDGAGHYTSEEAAVARLRQLLPDRSVLIVLDDVWQAGHVEPFRVTAPRCRVLFTTRDGSIALGMGAAEIRLDVLKPEQAVELLREWACREEPAFAAVADRLGYLPLGLKLAGARLREGMSGDDWLKTFQRVSQMKLGRRSTDPHDNLQVCFELSVRELPADDRLLYHALGIFPEDIWIPETAVVRLWRELSPGLADFDAHELAADLARLALVERNVPAQTITLHDLLHDYTEEQLGDRLIATHQALLRAYNPDGQPWHTIPHDGYLYWHLAYHLKAAGRAGELHTLLTSSPDWMRAKAQACVGDGAYISDLELLLADYHDPLPDAAALVRLAELHAARQVVHARVGRYTDKDLEILVWLDRTPEALGHARPRADMKDRFDGLLAIYKALVARKLPVGGLLDEIEAIARAILSAAERSWALRDLAFALAQTGLYERAETVAAGIPDDMEQTKALSALAGALARAGLYDRAEAVAAGFADAWRRAEALSEVAAALAQAGEGERAAEVFTQVETVAAGNSKLFPPGVQSLTRVVGRIAQAGLYEQAETVAAGIQVDAQRAIALSDLAGALARAGLYDRAETVAAGIQDDAQRAIALSELAAALAQAGERAAAVFTQAETVAAGIADAWRRADALRDLAAALAQAGDYDRAETVAAGIADAWRRADALRDLAAALAQAGLYERAETVAATLADDRARADALRDLAAALAQAGQVEWAGLIFDQVERVAAGIADASKRAGALRDLAAVLGQAEQYEQAERVVAAIQDDRQRAVALSEVATALAQSGQVEWAGLVFERAETVAGGIQDDEHRTKALSEVATALARSGQMEWAELVFERAETVAGGIQQDDWSLTEALRDLAAALAVAGLYERAETVAVGIQDDFDRSFALRALVAALAQAGLYDRAETVAATLADDRARADALRALAAALAQAGLYERAETVAAGIHVDAQRAIALSDLAAALAQAGLYERAAAVFTQAETVAAGIADVWGRADALRGLAAALAQAGLYERAAAVFTQAETAAVGITHIRMRVPALRALAAALAQDGQLRWALAVLGRREIEGFVQFLAECREGIIKRFGDGGQSAWQAMLRRALRIVAWERPDWREIYDIVKDDADTPASG